MRDNSASVARAMVDVLRERAVALQIPQREVAARAGLSQPRVSRVFSHGVALTFEVALRLCQALEFPLEEALRDAKTRTSGMPSD